MMDKLIDDEIAKDYSHEDEPHVVNTKIYPKEGFGGFYKNINNPPYNNKNPLLHKESEDLPF